MADSILMFAGSVTISIPSILFRFTFVTLRAAIREFADDVAWLNNMLLCTISGL
jgi:hypothetical protein